MDKLSSNPPRRYFVDAVGRRVLIGLTREETTEFEELDSQLSQAEIRSSGGKLLPQRSEPRWVELYTKHEEAWRVWISSRREGAPVGL
jgi:hypothetical protein